MQLVCKFVPGNAVSRDVLDYILSPDECIGQLSRTRNLQDVLRQLPKPLSDNIPQSAKKDIHSLLSNIKQRLVRVEWVALSSFARRTPLSDAQLQAYPALKMRVDEFASEQPKKVVKANYDTVTDDVPLARNLSFTPVEPSPDKKIVVEFAGQWPNNAAYLMLSETGTQKEKVAKPRKDSSKNHRSVSVFKSLEEEPRNLYLAIPLSGSATPLKLLLAENVEPVDSSDEMDEWDNVLVPVVPLYFLTGEKSEKSAARHMSGYIYVLWKDKVWRELAIDEKGYFSDINIDYYRNAQPESAKPKRHADIRITDPERGSPFSYEPFQIRQNGEVVSEGILNDVGEVRVFNLTEEEVEVVMTDYDPHVVVKVETMLSPFKGASQTHREASGRALPHIWIPYKILGEQQSVSLYYSEDQLSPEQLTAFESDPSQATELTDMEYYSSAQSFKTGEGATRALAIPNVSPEQVSQYTVIASQLEKTIAGVYINGPLSPLTFAYPSDPMVDESDDYFELRDTKGDWSQRTYLRDCVPNEKGIRHIKFSGWPAEVKNVDLVRGYLGQSRNKRDNLTLIFANKKLSDLLAYKPQ
ncbi:hypothetical protein G3U99_23680 [Vibrio coralliilyticus OCN008]|uniref:hypothetical protein n=1 Tax=Vibrio coralliilyticus TaxID=190893 RepID=UPI00039176A5|nr:hypothetical protein [Vibrio coralliilyticus]ERB65230.1 hypothetical protein N779_11345 [Vibrio coralliilyticus OCN008]QIJ87228.1 hypothetical protein G3U99_23680 [Vibrio coralliilyticus OCN008]